MYESAPLQTLSLHSLDEPDLRMEIVIYPDEASARSAPVHEQVDVVADEVWAGGPLDWSDEAKALRIDPRRWTARHLLARALAERIAPAVPSGFVEDALAAWLYEALGTVFEDPANDLEAALVSGAWSAIDCLEQEIRERVHAPWRPGHQELKGKIKGDWLALGYGLKPIPLSELGL
jgi:hypothetical protein